MKIIVLILLLSIPGIVNGQGRFRLNDASKYVDVEIDIGKCDDYGSICGPLKVSFFRKRAVRRFQTIQLSHTQTWDSTPKANITKFYDDQSVINFGDFNFDGTDDVAICDGANGGYGMPSYRVYLYSKTQKRFVYSPSFTRMNEGGLGMFYSDREKRIHFVYTKDGCCWHQTQGFDVYHGRPRKVYELIENAAHGDESIVEITTGKLIRGRWHEWTKHVDASVYYRQ